MKKIAVGFLILVILSAFINACSDNTKDDSSSEVVSYSNKDEDNKSSYVLEEQEISDNNKNLLVPELFETELEVICEENLVFSQYDVDVYIDDEIVGSIEHGKKETFRLSLSEGVHIIKFTEKGNNVVCGTDEFSVLNKSKIKYEINCKSSKVDFELIENANENIISDVTNEEISNDTTSEKPTSSELRNDGLYEVVLDIVCEENIIFSQYDIDVYVDDKLEGSVEHGKNEIINIYLSEGAHSIKFTEKGDDSVCGTDEISISGKSTVKYEIACYSSKVKVKLIDIIEEENIAEKSDKETSSQTEVKPSYSEVPETTPKPTPVSTPTPTQKPTPTSTPTPTPTPTQSSSSGSSGGGSSSGGSSGSSSNDYTEGEKTERMVWIPTNGGTKYHSRSSCSKMKDPIQVTLEEAQALGFTPCKKC